MRMSLLPAFGCNSAKTSSFPRCRRPLRWKIPFRVVGLVCLANGLLERDICALRVRKHLKHSSFFLFECASTWQSPFCWLIERANVRIVAFGLSVLRSLAVPKLLWLAGWHLPPRYTRARRDGVIITESHFPKARPHSPNLPLLHFTTKITTGIISHTYIFSLLR